MYKMKRPAFVMIAVMFVCFPAFAEEDARLRFEQVKQQAAEKVSFEAVDCDAGGSLARAVNKRNPDLVVWFIGTCEEQVEITRDDVVVRGFGGGSTVVGGVALQGSRIGLRDFNVRDADPTGIFVKPGSQVEILGLNIQDSTFRGILLEGATAEIRDVAITRSGTVGILNRSSFVSLFGTIETTEAGVAGLSATNGATYFTDGGATINASNNRSGMILQLDSTMEFAEGTLIASGNAVFGLLVAGVSSLAHGIVEWNLTNNGVAGLAVGENSSLTPFVGFGATINIAENGALGVLLVSQGNLEFGAGTTIVDNGGPGIVADESSLTIGGTTVTGNAPDLILTFGATGSFNEGNTLGSPIICNGPIETRGDLGCGDMATFGGAPGAKALPIESYRNLFKSR